VLNLAVHRATTGLLQVNIHFHFIQSLDAAQSQLQAASLSTRILQTKKEITNSMTMALIRDILL